MHQMQSEVPSAIVSLESLLEAGVHFGHQARRWNPRMRSYIYGERNGVHIIDLQKTQKNFQDALNFITKCVSEGGHVLCVGTKKQAQTILVEEAERAKAFHIHHRWLGGTLTNWQTVKGSITKLKRIEKMKSDGTYDQLPKHEILLKERLLSKLERSLGGIKNMPGLPSALFVIDAKKEFTAIAEAKRLGIPVIAIVDTNSDPTGIDYVIPGNDDSLKAISFYMQHVAEAVIRGKQNRQGDLQESTVIRDEREGPAPKSQIKVKVMRQDRV